ncbi:fructose-bisphosphatase class I [Candidatus Micrarchaeota archaeon CG10_big_fil_rev_8_21_14_0_10_45_29]|nr:MAG: fructose-bisphosphatase class I [Candidatus Micrarchaeota archaeon CG10_big_fil_rev_8_21_14_0_10_45_29]
MLGIKTLKEHLAILPDDLATLIETFAQISMDMQTNFPKYLSGVENEPNKYGEAVAKLDAWANKTLCDNLLQTGLVRKIYSEELQTPVEGREDAPFVITLDPLDGSSNITTNNAFGIILGIYRSDFPQKGRDLVAAAYKLYGPVNTLVYTTGKGVHEFVKHYYEDGAVRFLLLHENMKLPIKPEVFGVGGKPMQWSGNFREFAKNLFKEKKMRPRYCGTFVADFSQVLHRGGFFSYPSTEGAPDGKLRLAYECAPLSFICENAGGASWDGRSGSILDVQIEDADARIPLYLGNKEVIEELKKTQGN